jgi:hypothetical protein
MSEELQKGPVLDALKNKIATIIKEKSLAEIIASVLALVNTLKPIFVGEPKFNAAIDPELQVCIDDCAAAGCTVDECVDCIQEALV